MQFRSHNVLAVPLFLLAISAAASVHAAPTDATLAESLFTSGSVGQRIAHESAEPATEPRAARPPEPDAAPKPSDGRGAPAKEPDPSRAPAFVFAGVAVGGLVTGAVTGISAMSAASTYRAHCSSGICDPEGLSAASRGSTMSLVSPILFGVGIAGGAVAAYLFLSTRRYGNAAVIVPTVSPSFGGIVAARSF